MFSASKDAQEESLPAAVTTIASILWSVAPCHHNCRISFQIQMTCAAQEGSLPAAVKTVATASQSLPHTDSLLTAAYKYTRMNIIKTTNTQLLPTNT